MSITRSDRYSLTAKITEFRIPPVHDGLILGKHSAIGPSAFSKALDLLVADDVIDIPVDDDIVGHIFVRATITRKVPNEKLIDFVLTRIKPLMSDKEILHLNLNVDVTLHDDNVAFQEDSP